MIIGIGFFIFFPWITCSQQNIVLWLKYWIRTYMIYTNFPGLPQYFWTITGRYFVWYSVRFLFPSCKIDIKALSIITGNKALSEDSSSFLTSLASGWLKLERWSSNLYSLEEEKYGRTLKTGQSGMFCTWMNAHHLLLDSLQLDPKRAEWKTLTCACHVQCKSLQWEWSTFSEPDNIAFRGPAALASLMGCQLVWTVRWTPHSCSWEHFS